MRDLTHIGRDWLISEIDAFDEEIIHTSPVEFNEENRYLPSSVTSLPGPMRFDVNPYMEEIVNCADVDSGVRECSVMKGVQITYTTAMESILLYVMAHVRTDPAMFITADKELAEARIENNIIPMIQQSGFSDIIQSSDEGNSRKTGMTKKHIQWVGGGYLMPFGANNAAKMRSASIKFMLKDEIDGWLDEVGKDGEPDALSDARCTAYWESRFIFRGSTPLMKDSSKIYKNYMIGDQRRYFVCCRSCGFAQYLTFSGVHGKTGEIYGIDYEHDKGVLIPGSVRYKCIKCGHGHVEADKMVLFSKESGAHWRPTAKPKKVGVRSYHLPGLYSPYGFKSWEAQVAEYLEAFDVVASRVKDVALLQVFYNNTLGWPFEERGSKINFQQVSLHRRSAYRLGQIPNAHAVEYAGSKILMVTMAVDVHKSNLRVSTIGWTRKSCSYLIDYWRLEDADCTDPSSVVWGQVRKLIEEKIYVDDSGKIEYKIAATFIDAGFSNNVVVDFCASFGPEFNVYPIMGRTSLKKSAEVKHFTTGVTSLGTQYTYILVDAYKDRYAPILRREWLDTQQQDNYHFNAPVDTPDKTLKELTVEVKKTKRDASGVLSQKWLRPGNAANELWDLLVYQACAVEFVAYVIFMKIADLDKVNMPEFWELAEKKKWFFVEK